MTSLKQFARIEIDDVTNTPKTVPVAMPLGTPVDPWDGGAQPPSIHLKPSDPRLMNQEQRVAHLKRDELVAKAVGFDPKDPVYDLGTAVIDIGVENATRSRQEWEKGMQPADAVNEVLGIIQDERRSDVMLDLNTVQMSASGHIREHDKAPWTAMTKRSIRHLADLGGFSSGAKYFVEDCSPRVRAMNFNNQFLDRSQERASEIISTFNEMTKEEQAKVGAPDTSWPVRARTRDTAVKAIGPKAVNREVYAVTSPTYTPIDFRDIGETLVDAVNRAGGDARAEYKYDRDNAAGIIDFTFHSNLLPANYSAGEFFKMVMRTKWDDAKQGSVTGSAALLRNLCLNLYILHNSEVDVFRIIHAGSVKGRLQRLYEGIMRMLDMGEHFISKWSKASAYTIDNPRVAPIRVNKKAKAEIKTWNDCSVEERVAGLVMGYAKRNIIEEPTREELRQIVKAYRLDALTGGNVITVAAIANAESRAAKEALDAGTLDYWRSEKFQLAAGNIATTTAEPMFQYVHNLGL